MKNLLCIELRTIGHLPLTGLSKNGIQRQSASNKGRIDKIWRDVELYHMLHPLYQISCVRCLFELATKTAIILVQVLLSNVVMQIGGLGDGRHVSDLAFYQLAGYLLRHILYC